MRWQNGLLLNIVLDNRVWKQATITLRSQSVFLIVMWGFCWFFFVNLFYLHRITGKGILKIMYFLQLVLIVSLDTATQ